MTTASGKPTTGMTTSQPWPFYVTVESVSRIGDALLGNKSWDSMEVQDELQILFGHDEWSILKYVAEVRSRIKEWFILASVKFRKYEIQCYPTCSFYVSLCYNSSGTKGDSSNPSGRKHPRISE
jgi:hypothetical protein